MISTHFTFNLRSLTVVFVALLVAAIMWAQGANDTPIIIADGSLTIESRGVPWANWGGSGNTKVHPNPGKSVTQVVIAMPGNNRTVTFSGQKCTVAVRYASTDITVTTGNNGRGLQVMTDFGSFHAGATARHLAHNDASSKISHVTVTQGNQTAFDSSASGGTTVTISYQ
jgi:YbbR domain-containing protein